jgi:hypothetical protein
VFPWLLLALIFLVPGLASAQSAIAGVVKDTSGSVLPGVTVEASSPALIERTRAVNTDEQGRYNIVNLRPGTYKITFSLSGFSTTVRDGIELPTNVTLPIDVEMKVGALEETITVSGATPVVDIQNAQRTQVLTRDIVDALPVTRNSQSIAAVVPGVKLSRPDVGGSQMMEQVAQSTHGSLAKDISMQVDGMPVNSSMNDYGIQAYNDDALNQEVSVMTSSVPAEVGAGGVRINMIPKDGANKLFGALYAGGTPESWQSLNIDDNLRARGVRSPNGIQHIEDANASVGGPILQNRLWYFGSGRHISVNEKVTNAFYDDGSPAIVDQYVRSALARLTYQVSPKNKVSAYFQRIWKFKGHELSPGYDVETASLIRDPKHSLYYVTQGKWTSTATTRLLIEAGYSINMERLSQYYQPGIRQVPFTPAWYAQAARQDLVLNTLNTAALSESANLPNMYSVTASVSYVTGTHNIKGGMQWLFGRVGYQYTANADLVQLYRSGVPDSVRVYNTPTEYFTDVDANRGLYIQDAITLHRLTLNAGLRYDHLHTVVTDVALPAGRFVPARTFGQKDVVDADGNHLDRLPNWNDFSPRLSATYDLFGDAKTAIKASYNKYMVNWAAGFAQRYNPMTFSNDQRSWRDLNGDDIAQDNEIGPSNNASFGVAQTRFPASDLSREYNIEWSIGVQRELVPGVSVLAAWYDRRYKNTEKSLNQLLTLDDYVAFTAASPLDGSPITIYNLKPEKQGLVKMVDSNSDINQRIYKGYELSFNARLPRGANLFGGLTADQNLRISCDTNDPNQLRFCDETKYDIPFRPDFKLAGNYPMPYGFQFSGVIMSYAGNAQNTNSDGSTTTYLRDNWVVPASVFPNGQRTQSVTVNLIEPGSKFGERWNQVDISVKRVFRHRSLTLTPQLDIYNLFNGNTVLTQNQAYGSALDQPLTILQGRIFRAAMQMKF